MLKYVVCLYKGFDGCCGFYLLVSCVHPVAVLNAAFCMTCSLLINQLMLVKDARGIYVDLQYDETVKSKVALEWCQ